MGKYDSVFSKKYKPTPSAKTVLEKRYLKRDLSGKPIEKPEDMFRRVAETIAKVDEKYDPEADVEAVAARFYEMMVDRDFMPNSPTLMNAGRVLGQLSACFVLPIDDSIESIFETLKHAALIHKSGGGTGYSFSRIRPKNDIVKSTAGVSSGPVSFMKVYDAATEAIKQGGTRRGANMGILRVDHPDILEFINVKREPGVLTNFNISVAITDEFMNAYFEDREYELINPRNGKAVKKLRARDVFDMLVESAWASAEPGVIFIDRINADNPTPHIGEIESTNPCGEQPLLPYESCNLGSINLSNFVVDGKIDWERLAKTVHDAVHFLDNVIDANKFPLPQIKEMTFANRKIGLGVMGFAEMLIKLRIPYNSDEAVRLAEKVMSFIQSEGRKKSAELAEKRGVFPNWKGSVYEKQGLRVRNATVTTIAPTGTISIIAGTSSGIEPLFALAFERHVLDGERLVEVNQLLLEELKKRGLYSDDVVEEILEKGSLKDIAGIPEDMKRVYVVAYDVDPEWHIRVQAAFQKYTDNAVSKTINYPNSATVEDIKKGYLLAYELGLKGITVYRDGSREAQVLYVGAKKKEEETKPVRIRREVRERPKIVHGMTFKIATGCGNLYVTVNEDEYGPFEVFSHLGKTGGCASSQSEALSRMISIALRSGVPIEEIVDQLRGIRCPNLIWDQGQMVLSCPDAIAKALQWYIDLKKQKQGALFPQEELRKLEAKRGTPKAAQLPEGVRDDLVFCPECGSRMMIIEGCATCPVCGYSKCS